MINILLWASGLICVFMFLAATVLDIIGKCEWAAKFGVWSGIYAGICGICILLHAFGIG